MNVHIPSLVHHHGAVGLFALFLAADLLLPITTFARVVDHPNAVMHVLGNALPYGPWFNCETVLGPVLLILAINHVARLGDHRPCLHWVSTPPTRSKA